MDDGEEKCKNILKDLHFKAVNTRNAVPSDEKKELLKRPKFTVVPAQLPTSASQCDTGETKSIPKKNEKGLSTSATSPASIGLPAVITPTRPSMCKKNRIFFLKTASKCIKNHSGLLQNIIWLTMS